MRRPNLCGSGISIIDEPYKPASNKEGGQVGVVRRILGGASRKKEATTPAGGNLNSKQFGVPLSQVSLFKETIPFVLHRICSFLEKYGMNDSGLFKAASVDSAAVEALRSQFDCEGDARLEECGQPAVVAAVLRLWLRSLPQPLISKQLLTELLSIHAKYEGDELWGSAVLESLLSSSGGDLLTACLAALLGLLHSYCLRHPPAHAVVPAMFGLLLAPAPDNAAPDAHNLFAALIHHSDLVFHNLGSVCGNGGGDGSNSLKKTALVISEIAQSQQNQRKRKDRLDVGPKPDCPFIRSNSEERPAVKTSCSGGDMRGDSMRRVSSHEDFSKSRLPKPATPSQVRKVVHPLHERNLRSPEHLVISPDPSDKLPVTCTVGYASDLYDENEHEIRRNNERFAPQRCRSLAGRRRKKHRTHLSKENHIDELKVHDELDAPGDEALEVDQPESVADKLTEFSSCDLEDSTTPVTSSSEQSLKLQDKPEENVDKCPSPTSGVYSPMLDLNAREEQPSEAIPSAPHWASNPPSDERMVSPRNSVVISRRMISSGPPEDVTILDLTAQIQSIKQKLKKYEEGFEREFGFKPSQADKLANPDIKKMLSMQSKLKKQLRSKKDEMRISVIKEANSTTPVITEKIVDDIEKKLKDKMCGKSLESLDYGQLMEEKAAMQRALLQLEATFGRPQSKKDRDLVRPLYDRYRLLKRSLLKQTPSKMKESVSELGTILEHEAMDFSGGASSGTLPGSPPRVPSPPLAHQERKSISQQVVLDNLHSLPQEELIEIQKETRDEKKRLKRNLKQQELEIQNRTGRRISKEERPPSLEPLYTDYKQAKAKLKFIDALINKSR